MNIQELNDYTIVDIETTGLSPDKDGKVTVPNHKGDIPKGTANSILKQAGLR